MIFSTFRVVQPSLLSNYRMFLSPFKTTAQPLAVTSHSPLPMAPDNYPSTFCLYVFAYSGKFISVESYNMCPFFFESDYFSPLILLLFQCHQLILVVPPFKAIYMSVSTIRDLYSLGVGGSICYFCWFPF